MGIYVDENILMRHQQNALMALEIYPYKNADGTRKAALVWHGTGSGKTLTILAYALRMAALGEGHTIIVAPGIKTVSRFQEEWLRWRGIVFKGQGLPDKFPVRHSQLASNDDGAEFARTRVAFSMALGIHEKTSIWGTTINSLYNRVRERNPMLDPQNVATLIIDEGAHAAADIYRTVVDYFPNARVIYTTATPVRVDKEILPLVPFTKSRVSDKKVAYAMHDIETVTGIAGSRYTLQQAIADRKVKPLAKSPVLVDVTPGMKITADAGSIESSSLDGLRNAAADSERRILPYTEDAVLLPLLAAGKAELDAINRQFPLRRWKAIIGAADARAAEVIAIKATQIGMRSVAYHTRDLHLSDRLAENDEDREMAQRLALFEDQMSGVEAIVQVDALNEGYSNEAITLGIHARNCESEPRVAQMNGRLTRLFADLEYDEHPPITSVCLDYAPTSETVDSYHNLRFETLYFEVLEKGGGGGTGIANPIAAIDDSVQFSAYVNGKAIDIKLYDQYSIAADNWFKPYETDIDPAVLGKMKAQMAREKKLAILDSINVIEKWKEIRSACYAYLYANTPTHRGPALTDKWKAKVPAAVNATIGRKWPSLKGGYREGIDADAVELVDFVTYSLTALKIECHQRIAAWMKEKDDDVSRDSQ